MSTGVDSAFPRVRRRPDGRERRWLSPARGMTAGMIASGLLALLWLVLRTGTRPSRFAYPCQQAALATATLTFGVPAVMVLLAVRRRILAGLRTSIGKIAAGVLIGAGLFAVGSASFERGESITLLDPPADHHPLVFSVPHVRGIEPGRFGGVDDLITLMGIHGMKWHRSETVTLTAGPDGLIDPDDVVLIKINAQWAERGGTNTDVLRGIIRRVVEHPEGFTGEVIVADNGQGSGSMTRPDNNAEDHGQSPFDVAEDFQNEGWHVSTWLWDDIRSNPVEEYAMGDWDDGYIVNPAPDPETNVNLSYPKFHTEYGTYVSYRFGVWNPDSQTYDADRLVVINVPVLKTHYIYGTTASVKNHMGVVSQSLVRRSHFAVADGGLGSLLADVRTPDLTILDCIWICAIPDDGPWSYYSLATRRDQLVAGRDPVALDMWGAKNVMVPAIIANGYIDSEDYPDQDPDNPQGDFRRYLDRSMNELLLAGIAATNDYNAVRLRVWGGDADHDGDVDVLDFANYPGCMGGPENSTAGCDAFDVDEDGAVDLRDFAEIQQLFSGYKS